MKELVDVLAQIAARPEGQWPELVAQRFPNDAKLAAQALIWLRSNRERVDDDDVTPELADERYQLGVLLDVGATASVWQAHDAKLNRNVAVKVFRGERSPVLDEILTEARAAAEIASDHVVRVLDVHDQDPTNGGAPYIVMELVGEWEPRKGVLAPGGSAATVRPRTHAEAVRWVRDVARGVHDAHLRNVFHRDLKPHNVLITPVSRRARIADFGLANRTGGGTPEYIAPELARLAGAHDREHMVAVDVWGLGALAYDLLGGRPPWPTWDAAVSGESPPPLDVPRRLQRVIAKAMALDPAQRYATAGEVAHDLDAFLEQRPTSLDRSHVLRAGLWMRRNPQLSLTAAAALALAVITLAGYASLREIRGKSRALAAEVRQEEQTNDQLTARMAKARAELAQTEADVAARGQALAALQRALADEQKQYEGIIAARDKALHEADAATRQLVDQLTVAQSDRAAAELGRQMYEGFWNSARQDVDRVSKDREQAQHERDAARGERDQLQVERDAAQAERERALAEVQRLTEEAAASHKRVEELTRLLGAGSGSGSAAPAAAGSDVAGS
jgi:serine/threonine-protein kinase